MTYRLNEEQWIQITVVSWVQVNYPDIAKRMIHIANERKTSPYQGSILKKMGVMPGVSDLFFIIPTIEYNGLFIEIKSLKGRVSPAQKKFIHQVILDGYQGKICYGFDEVIDAIKEYFSL